MNSFMLLSLSFAGALAAFLRFNWHPSRLFMGDAGSMTIGFVLAFLAIELSQKPGSIVSPVTVLIVLTVPVTDTLTVMAKRMMNRKSPFAPDKTHFHHLLRDMGFGHAGSVMIIMTISMLFSLLAIGATMLHVHDYYLFGLFVCWFGFYFRSSQTMGGLFTCIELLNKQHSMKSSNTIHA
jgi:UDP-GlcNAc:undecaprenyl-phosphate GlcNAc-1-phosphate transferase